MADVVTYGVAENGTYSTSAPNPNVSLVGTSPSNVSIAQIFTEAMTNGQTTAVTIRVDIDNWAVYSGAALTTGSPNILDLTGAVLLDSGGTIADAATVTVYGLQPQATFVSSTEVLTHVGVPASPTASGTKGNWSADATYVYLCVATDTWWRITPLRVWT